MSDTSFLSVRVPAELRGRIKRLAAERGTSVQALVRAAIEDYLREQDRPPPDLADVVATLRAHEPELRARGIEHLYVFGSTVRGEARGDSDVDLAIDVNEDDDAFSLITLASINAQMEEWLGRSVDLGERSTLRPELESEFGRDAVRIF